MAGSVDIHDDGRITVHVKSEPTGLLTTADGWIELSAWEFSADLSMHRSSFGSAKCCPGR